MDGDVAYLAGSVDCNLTNNQGGAGFAWMEIMTGLLCGWMGTSLPSREAWIEIAPSSRVAQVWRVASLAGSVD